MNNPELWKTWEGRTVDAKFPLRQWLGGSEHSAVFLTERAGPSSQKAAIKLVPSALIPPVNDDLLLAHWRAAAKLSHPHLIPIFAIGSAEIDGTSLLYLVSDYAEEDLSQILPQRALSPAEVGDMLPPILDAVGYLHAQGYVHAGIRPSNVLASGDQLKLAPDRICRAGVELPRERSRDMFDAPETAIEAVTPAADIWSVGALLVAALTGRAPIEGAEPEDPKVPDSIAEPFRGIARNCLRNDPALRYSLAQINAKLHPGQAPNLPVAQPQSQPAPAPVQVPTAKPVPSAQRQSTNWRVVGPFAIVLVIAAALIGYVVTRHSQAPPVSKIDETTSPAPAASTPSPATLPDSSGSAVRQVLPDAPASAMQTIQGTIKIAVRVAVDDSGKVTVAKLTSSGHSPYFANLALEAAQRWQFSPPIVEGQPVPSTWILRFQLKKSGAKVTAARAR